MDDLNEFDNDNVIVLFDDDGNEEEFFILGDVDFNNEKYLVVTDDLDPESDEQNVVVLKETSTDNDDVDYHIVDDDNLLDNIINLFEENFNDIDDEDIDDDENEDENDE